MKLFLALGAATAALLTIACSDTGGGGALHVTLNEWSITLDKTSLPEGPIEFTIKNDGKNAHDFVIVRTDIAPDQLPTKSDGSVDLNAPDVDEVRTVDDLGDGDETGRTYDLSAGHYVFIDNRVEDENGQKVAYYKQGMHVGFTVTKEGEPPSASPTATQKATGTRTPIGS